VVIITILEAAQAPRFFGKEKDMSKGKKTKHGKKIRKQEKKRK
jgi:hypothetical protein